MQSGPVILLPTVPRRQKSCATVLRALLRQTTKPYKIIVIYDGPEDDFGSWVSAMPGGPAILFTATPQNRAQHYRWILNETLHPDRIVMTMDDDMIISPRYVERTLDALEALDSDNRRVVVSWGGIDLNLKWRQYHDPHSACALLRPQSGVMAFRSGLFHGISDTEFSKVSHVRGGSEELPLAWWCDTQMIRIVKPSTTEVGGGPPLQPARCAFEPEASHRKNFHRWKELLAWAEHGLGWDCAKPLRQLYEGKQGLRLNRLPPAWGDSPEEML